MHLLTFIRLLFLINAVCNICKVNVFTQFICFDLIQKLYVTARAWHALFDKFEKKGYKESSWISILASRLGDACLLRLSSLILLVVLIILRVILFTWLVLRQNVRYLKNQALIHLCDLISESGHLNSNHAVTPSRFVHRRELNRRNKSESPLAYK